MSSSVRNVGGNCHWVFGFFTTMRPVHKSLVAQQAVRNCGFLQLNHPAYSPDLAPNDCYQFRKLKSHHHGTRFADDESPKAVVEAWFKGHDREFFFPTHKQLTRKVAKMHWCCRRPYRKMTVWLKFCDCVWYQSCKTFWSSLVTLILTLAKSHNAILQIALTHELHATKTLGLRAYAMTYWRVVNELTMNVPFIGYTERVWIYNAE